LLTSGLAARVVWAEIDREARKGKPLPSDHTPLVIDLDAAGHAFDAGWKRADEKAAGDATPRTPRPRVPRGGRP
jgi:exodeoxyribonuclease-3